MMLRLGGGGRDAEPEGGAAGKRSRDGEDGEGSAKHEGVLS
jgi:hypothetical protein